jgi:hypothetical protein
VRLIAGFDFESIRKHLYVVKFVVASVPLRLKLAWISAAFVTLMLAVQAVVVSNSIRRLERTHDA